jgi:hypothetical protein
MCGLDLYSQAKLQLRKGRFGETDLIGDVDGKKIRPVSWEGRRWPDMRGHVVSDATEKEGATALSRGCWASGQIRPKADADRAIQCGRGRRSWSRPESAQAGNDARAETMGRGERVGYRAKSEEKDKFLFLFPFQLFQSIFK